MLTNYNVAIFKSSPVLTAIPLPISGSVGGPGDVNCSLKQVTPKFWCEHIVTIHGYGHSSDPGATFRHSLWLVDNEALALGTILPNAYSPAAQRTWVDMVVVGSDDASPSFGQTPTGVWSAGYNKFKTGDSKQEIFTSQGSCVGITPGTGVPIYNPVIDCGPSISPFFSLFLGDVYGHTVTTSGYSGKVSIPSGDRLLQMGVPATVVLTLAVLSEKVRGSNANDTAASISITPAPYQSAFREDVKILGKTQVDIMSVSTRMPITTSFDAVDEPLLVSTKRAGALSVSLDSFNGLSVGAIPVINPPTCPIWTVTNESLPNEPVC